MDRRANPRSPSHFEVTVTELSRQNKSGSGWVRDISESGVGVTLPFALNPGAIVKLDLADSSLFGHVAHCRADGENYVVGFQIEQVLLGGTDVSKLLNRLLHEANPRTPGLRRTLANQSAPNC